MVVYVAEIVCSILMIITGLLGLFYCSKSIEMYTCVKTTNDCKAFFATLAGAVIMFAVCIIIVVISFDTFGF